MLSEVRLDLDPVLQAPRALAPLIDPNVHSCGSVPPHGAAELAQPEPGLYVVGMKSYGRAPTFLTLTGYEQVRSVVAALAGDHDGRRAGRARAARDRRLRRQRPVRRLRHRRRSAAVAPPRRVAGSPSSRAPSACVPGHRDSHDRDVLNHVETGQDVGVAVSLRRRVLAVLGLTQIVSWGVLYYAFPVLAPSISRDTGWSTPSVTAAFSLALVTSAAVGLAGRSAPRPARSCAAS